MRHLLSPEAYPQMLQQVSWLTDLHLFRAFSYALRIQWHSLRKTPCLQ